MGNKNTPLVTIAIPTYNRADSYLRQTLQAARAQTYSNLEIIVSDNCSRDDTEILVNSIVDLNVRYFKHSVNIGANNNFNFCLKEARGEYFLLLSDDDLIDHDFIETAMRAVKGNFNIGTIRTGIRIINADSQVLSETPNIVSGYSTDELFMAWFAGKAPIYLCNTLFHTKRLQKIGGFKSKYNLYDDAIAQLTLIARYDRIDIADIKASFRSHESEMTFAADIRQWCEESLILLDLMCELAPENKKLIRHEGMYSFCRRNYFRAGAVKPPLKRFLSHMIVLKTFNYRYCQSFYVQKIRRIKHGMRKLRLR